jgi:hypothetical protein
MTNQLQIRDGISRWVCALATVIPIVAQSGIARSQETEYFRNIREAKAVLERYLKCEEKEDYGSCYDLFSSAIKRGLKDSSGITVAGDYKKARRYERLRWVNPVITDEMSFPNAVVTFSIEVTFEKWILGHRIETDRLGFSVFMGKEHGRWVIDSISGGGGE